MAPIKFEEDIQDKLERRKVVPSKTAWDKLSQRLDEDKKTTRQLWLKWVGIAATLTLLISLSIYTFIDKPQQLTPVEIVSESIVQPIPTENTTPPKEEKKTQQFLAEQPKPVEKMKRNVVKNDKPSNRIAKQVPLKKSVQTNATKNTLLAAIGKMDKNNKDSIQLSNKILSETKVLLSATEKKLTIDDEIEALLNTANQKLVLDNALKDSLSIVDAKALLDEVEANLGESFRTRIYEALKETYKKAKTAVVERKN